MTDAEYVDLIGAANLIPGPTSSEVAMHVGHRRAGWVGLVVAGLAFVLPSVLIVAALAWAYVSAGTRVVLDPILADVGPVVIALIVHAGWAIGRTAIRDRRTGVVAAAAVVGALLGLPEIALLLGLGLVTLGIAGLGRIRDRVAASLTTSLGPLDERAVVWAIGPGGPTPLALLAEFAVIGATLFGSGYVLVAFLQAELVERLGWIDPAELVDAIAVGQATPGPVFSTATFIGYLISGPVGAAAATVGIFLPAFLAVAVSVPLLDRLRTSAFRAFLDGVNAAAVGLLAVVAVRLGADVLVEPTAWVIGLVALALLLRGVSSVWLIAAAAVVGIGRIVVPAIAPGLLSALGQG